MKSFLKKLRPNHTIYLLLHVILFIVGSFFIAVSSFSEEYHEPWRAVGASLVAAAITGWVIFVYLFFQRETSKRLNLLADFGFVDAFSARQVLIKPEYDTRLQVARDKIDIIGFGLSAFLEDFKNEFPNWCTRAHVRILLLDPEYPTANQSYADQRDREEGVQVGRIGSDVRQFVKEAYAIVPSGHARFQIKLYRCLPMINIFRIDDEIFWGPYLLGSVSRNMPTFLVKRGGILFDLFLRHFENIWNDDFFSLNISPDKIKAV